MEPEPVPERPAVNPPRPEIEIPFHDVEHKAEVRWITKKTLDARGIPSDLKRPASEAV